MNYLNILYYLRTKLNAGLILMDSYKKNIKAQVKKLKRDINVEIIKNCNIF
jgi:hypothetical protein